MELRQAVFSVNIDGRNASNNFESYLISLVITLTDGGKSDSLEMELDDSHGQLILPREGADIDATLGWADRPGEYVTFQGKTDQPRSEGTRGGGMIMNITAHATDLKGEPKHKFEKHKDDSTFEEAAKKWGEDIGLNVRVDEKLKKIQRKYWDMRNESYMSWGQRMAEELGMTFKIMGNEAIFIPRNSVNSVSGKPLVIVQAEYGVNIIKWDITPLQNRPRYKQSIVRWYDPKEAKYKKEKVDIGDRNLKPDLIDTQRAPDKDQAHDLAGSNSEESKRGKGAGQITLDGEPAAQSQALITVTGIRDGIDGLYQIKTARHELNRQNGWTTDCDLEHPTGASGADDRSPTP